MNHLVEQALVFIGASLILVPIFRLLGFGSVLGYLIAGMVVGPFGLKLSQDQETMMKTSELGVVFLLFLIGLEIQPFKLWSMRRHLIGLGGMQVLLTTVVFFLLGKLLAFESTEAWVLGFALSLSSTAFAVQMLTEKGQFNTEFGRASFSVLLMQDLIAIPALAAIPALVAHPTVGEGEANQNLWLGLALIVALIAASRFVVRPLFRLVARLRSREIFTAATLFTVLGVAALMQVVGLSAALGSFIAGVVLADSEYRHELESNLEPFKSLLMGLFFIAVGMGVRLDLLFAKPFLITLFVLLYLAAKSAVLYATGRVFRLSHVSALQMASNVSQGGEFAFVIFGIAAQLALSPNDTLAVLTVIVTLSMALNPILGRLVEWLVNAKVRNAQQKYDEIKGETPEVIVAGFGRFGQVIARVLRSQDVSFVAIDRDPEQIEMVRKFGNKVYYGDASRHDLLEAAGAANAKYLVLAIDDVESSLAAARVAIENYPNLKIFARARNRGHAFDLMHLGVKNIKRETFDSSLLFTGELLREMGVSDARTLNILEKFRQHDQIMLEEQYKVRNDDKMFISTTNQAAAQLAQVLRDDQMQSHIQR